VEIPAYVNVPDFLKIGIFAIVFIFLANKFMDKVGFDLKDSI